jgi:biopolymer transport protein ExbD
MLNDEKSKLEWVKGLKGENVKFPGMVIIQGDKGIPFHYIEKVMFTCGQAEYNNISLAVYKQES